MMKMFCRLWSWLPFAHLCQNSLMHFNECILMYVNHISREQGGGAEGERPTLKQGPRSAWSPT